MTVWMMKVLLILQSKWLGGDSKIKNQSGNLKDLIKVQHFVSMTV